MVLTLGHVWQWNMVALVALYIVASACFLVMGFGTSEWLREDGERVDGYIAAIAAVGLVAAIFIIAGFYG